MNVDGAISAIVEDFDREFFHMSLQGDELTIIQLTGESHAGEVEVSVNFEKLKLFEMPDEDTGELETIDQCKDRLEGLVFVSKDDYPYFVLGYEPEYILSVIFPQLPDPIDSKYSSDRQAFVDLAKGFIDEVFKEA